MPASRRAESKQAQRDRDAAEVASGRRTVQDLRAANEAFTFERSAVSIRFERSFS
jgi:hypothetical protein